MAWGLSGLALLLVIELHLLAALLAGLLVFELVKVLTPWLRLRRLGLDDNDSPRLLAVALIATLVIAALAALGLAATAFLRNSGESLPILMQRMAQIVDDARQHLPDGLLAYVPADADAMRIKVVEWLREHAGSLQLAGRDFGRSMAHILIGMIIGALLSLQNARPRAEQRPLSMMVMQSAGRLASVFRRVVFAQAWISAINTLFTWLYLGVLLPLLGIDLPLTKTLIAITFLAGLVPILGNLISNTAIIIVSFSKGLPIAVGSLAFLIIIHKLEYFLNARIIGANIRASAWELLIVMLVMEAAFGIPGLIAAPIFYAYFKDALREKGLV
ncbi:AI-2E family transporter [Solimonas sp. C16B3]|uniref:AI-2E family transporter n=2 Tax=Solimonas marina TaxID=2714601 RepID=A0A969W826_9GAMM|nr:AI-2E family transporter [Solimonas marina]